MPRKQGFWTVRLCFFVAPALSFLAFPLSAQFMYVANSNDGTVSGLAINPATGTLTPVPGSPFAAGTVPISVAVDPSGRFAYVANVSDNTVLGYSINATTGTLTPLPDSPFLTASGPFQVVVDPTGRFAYVANDGAGAVSAYKINSSTGALTPISGSPFPAGSVPRSLAIDASDRFVYVANQNDNTISGLTIDPATGALAPMSTPSFDGGFGPIFVTVHISGRFVYALDNISVRLYALDPVTGSLTFLGFSAIPEGSPNLRELTIDPRGHFLYVANNGSITNNIVGYAINPSTGALTLISGSPFTDANKLPAWVSIDPSGKFAYVANANETTAPNVFGFGSTVTGYSVDPVSGALTSLPGSPFVSGNAGSGPISIAITPPIGDCGSISPSSLSFPNQVTQTSSKAETLVFTNGGSSLLAMNSIGTVGPFQQSNNCGSTLAAGAHCDINVTFVPNSVGAQTGILTIIDSGPMSPHAVNLDGTAVDNTPNFTISVASGSPASQVISPGSMASYKIALAQSAGAPASVNLTCAGQPQDSTCSINPHTLEMNAASKLAAVVSITTTGPGSSASSSNQSRLVLPIGWLSVLIAVVLFCVSRRIRVAPRTAFAIAMILTFAFCGCSSSKIVSPTAGRQTPAGTYTITITATSGTLVRSTDLQLTIR